MPGIELSLILPAYNEAARLPPYLRAIRAYLDARAVGPYEVIVVDDGSQDGLPELLNQFSADWPQLRWIGHTQNLGKGAAVRTGVLAAQGASILFADADGATPIEEERRLSDAIREGADLAIGSRRMPGADTRRSRQFVRQLLGAAFAGLARRLLRLPVHDTQCGFKMFRADVGRRLFSMTTESRYLFDLELLVLAQRLSYKIVEVPINWREVPGGHLHPVRELPQIIAGLWHLRHLRAS